VQKFSKIHNILIALCVGRYVGVYEVPVDELVQVAVDVGVSHVLVVKVVWVGIEKENLRGCAIDGCKD
jgi:hypothetical protein